ncbi:MAG: hypothetical protein K0B81_03685 [Candidatus Cloacimonetes bacterium]|nr:hypothetical protein [Candidatus Cloacimonadota bacterium]
MRIPFSVDQFLSLFKIYNITVWPIQIFFYLVALLALFLTVKRSALTDKMISIIIAYFWLWMGVIFHLFFFTMINKGAYLFGVLFIIQSILFLYFGLLKSKLSYELKLDLYGITGSIFILYALAVYPLLGHFSGHTYPHSPTFGAPCPTTIFTFGILLLTIKKVPKIILIIPFLWSLTGFSAALNLLIREDFGLLIAGLLGTILIIIKDRKGCFDNLSKKN